MNRNSTSRTSELMLRLGRRLLWPRPILYRPIGLWRKRIPADLECDLWVGGYPRSANTFLWKSLEAALPARRIITHLHIPPLIIEQLHKGKPGIFVIRNPQDAVVSWSIFTGLGLRHCLDYYIDFHEIMWRFRSELIIASFDAVTKRPRETVEDLANQFRLQGHPTSAVLNEETLGEVMRAIDRSGHSLNERGEIDEMKVSRPSDRRSGRASALKLELQTSSSLRPVLVTAERLYREFAGIARPVATNNSKVGILSGALLPVDLILLMLDLG